MPHVDILAGMTVAISVSDSPDLGPIGMSSAHLRDATAELARHLLASGARIAYGGDLRQGGFTEILFELVARHKPAASEGNDSGGIVSYLAWPVHMAKPFHDLERYADDLRGMATLLLLDQQGETLDMRHRHRLHEHQSSPEQWVHGLLAMRRRMGADTDARIIAGGQVAHFKGAMPGVAEEAQIAIKEYRPLYVLGGFGGCAADIAESLGLRERRGTPERTWQGRAFFADKAHGTFNNGLTAAENSTLARTPHVDEAAALVLRGLLGLERARSR